MSIDDFQPYEEDLGLPPRPNWLPDGPFAPLDPEYPRDAELIEKANGDEDVIHELQALRLLGIMYETGRVTKDERDKAEQWVEDKINVIRAERDT